MLVIKSSFKLAYITQACISNLKLMQCKQSHDYAHIKCKQTISWAFSPYLCASLVQEFWSILFSSMLLPLCPCPCPTSTSLSQSLPKLSYLCTISPPLSSISIKGVLLIDAKVCIWGRWLRLESCIFYGYHLIVGMTPLVDTTCNLYHLYLV